MSRALPVERQRLVRLEEVVVAAELDGAVAGVGNRERDRLQAPVELDFAGSVTTSPGITMLFPERPARALHAR